ncbi:hypothetical protein BRADI_1g73872v3 [Brachypodium distachyon]|uniref:Uncharacterized protein n=1 Tax=Brachypodium distachyon TaxID=15368 RepID=A0A2K2DV13_BRADI|nr:hypothetical protein BRADI_1g73872v3 [Brachypodium distachyon]
MEKERERQEGSSVRWHASMAGRRAVTSSAAALSNSESGGNTMQNNTRDNTRTRGRETKDETTTTDTDFTIVNKDAAIIAHWEMMKEETLQTHVDKRNL